MTAHSNELSKVTQKMILKHVIQGSDRKENNSVFVAGLAYMLDKKYFDDAFMLHVESEGHKQFDEIIFNLMQDDTYETSEIIKELDTYDNSDNIKNDENNDIRTILDKSWANFGNLFKYQPLKKVRDYFGEYVVLYFSFSGALVVYGHRL
jgi:hypothetical protein